MNLLLSIPEPIIFKRNVRNYVLAEDYRSSNIELFL